MGYRARGGSGYNVRNRRSSFNSSKGKKPHNTLDQWFIKNSLSKIDTTPKFVEKKDYGKVKLFVYKNRDFLIREAYDETFEKQMKYAKRIADILNSLPKGDTEHITYVVLDPDYGNAGELAHHIGSKVYDEIGKKEAKKFLRRQGITDKTNGVNYGLIFGSELWSENKNHLPHLVRHEVGHLKRYTISQEKRDKLDADYQNLAKQFLEIDDSDIKRRIDGVDWGMNGHIWRIRGLSNISFRKDLYDKYGIPSIYSMSQPSEYTAELYAFGLLK